MDKSDLGRRALKASAKLQSWLLIVLLIGPVAAVGIGSWADKATFFERYLLGPLAVSGAVVAIGIVNIAAAWLIRRICE
jgi:hypothetical protein